MADLGGGSASAHWPHLESFLSPRPFSHPLPALKQDLRPGRTHGLAHGAAFSVTYTVL